MIDYPTLKVLAKQIGCRVNDVIALAPPNDPFATDLPFRTEKAEWFASLWEEHGFSHGAHIRRIHYVLVSQTEPVIKWDGEPYENIRNDWQALVVASRDARYRGLIPGDALVDRQADEPRLFARGSAFRYAPQIDVRNSYTPVSFADFPDPPNLELSSFYRWHDYMVEVWIEKSTQNDWLAPFCQNKNVNLIVGKGEISEVHCRQAFERARKHGKPLRILYISDFDPGGRSMPVAVARKIEFHLREQKADDLDVALRPVFLTDEQVAEYKLPRTPIKESERRRSKFEESFGVGATELDAMEALHPHEMARVLKKEIDRYYDPTLSDRIWKAERRITEKLEKIEKRITAQYEERLQELESELDLIREDFREWEEKADETWNQMAKEMEVLAPKVKPSDIPKPKPEGDPDEPALFHSKRDYLTQMDHYHDWQRRELRARS
jgi:vacuolar-type H+-ATPase subunit H